MFVVCTLRVRSPQYAIGQIDIGPFAHPPLRPASNRCHLKQTTAVRCLERMLAQRTVCFSNFSFSVWVCFSLCAQIMLYTTLKLNEERHLDLQLRPHWHRNLTPQPSFANVVGEPGSKKKKKKPFVGDVLTTVVVYWL